MAHHVFSTGRESTVFRPEDFAAAIVNEETRGDPVHANTRWRQVNRQPCGKADHAGFGHGVRRNAGERPIAVHRGEIQNGTAAKLRHLTTEYLAWHDRPERVDTYDIFKPRQTQIEKPPRAGWLFGQEL